MNGVGRIADWFLLQAGRGERLAVRGVAEGVDTHPDGGGPSVDHVRRRVRVSRSEPARLMLQQ